MMIYVKKIYIFSLFFRHYFIRCIDFTHISASNSKWWRHNLGHT